MTTRASCRIPDDRKVRSALQGSSAKPEPSFTKPREAAQRAQTELVGLARDQLYTCLGPPERSAAVGQTEYASYRDQVIEALSDTELHFTEVIERWYDPSGRYGPPEHYYVLVRMKRTDAQAILRKMQ